MKFGVLALAVQGALLAMYAMPASADDADAASLKMPANYVEIGGANTWNGSAKFGEYSGLNKSGGSLIGNFSYLGGDAYGDAYGTKRWALTGTDLGLTTRNVNMSMSDQGRWNIGISYDELRHNLSDSYQTPYLGAMGGNSFVLPSTFTAVSTATPGTRALTATQLGAFNKVDISTTRENTAITGGLNLNRQWDVKVDFNHLDQSGAKLMGFGSYGSALVGGTGTNEKISILPIPTNYTTDTVNAALNWVGDKAHATGSYYGSFFRDNNSAVNFQTFTGAINTQKMGTPPSNDFHQLNLNGGYAFTARTKLAGGLSYSRNTQNTAYNYDTFAMVTPSPTSSLNGAIVNTHADLKLTDQTTNDLALSAALKYNNRDNRTASNIYNFNAISGGNTANYPNTPLSIKNSQLELAADYRIDKKQQVRLAYNYEEIRRWCNQYAVNTNYPANINCVTAIGSKENKLGFTYKRKANEVLNYNVGYSYSDRRAEMDQNARAAFIGTNGNVLVTGGLGITGINAGDFRGFNPWFEATREQRILKAGLNWQATDKLSVMFGGRHTTDDYGSDLGVQAGSSWGVNLDATYSYRENGSITAYVSQQERKRDLKDMQRASTTTASAASATAIAIPIGATWTNYLTDTDTTLGLSMKQGGLMSGKLELVGDLAYSLGRSSYRTQLNYSTTTTGGLTCSDPSILSCGALPVIRNAMVQFKLNATYQLDKSSKVAVGYLYRHLNADDYYYNGLQNGVTPTSVMPTNQQLPNYTANLVSVSYIRGF